MLPYAVELVYNVIEVSL